MSCSLYFIIADAFYVATKYFHNGNNSLMNGHRNSIPQLIGTSGKWWCSFETTSNAIHVAFITRTTINQQSAGFQNNFFHFSCLQF